MGGTTAMHHFILVPRYDAPFHQSFQFARFLQCAHSSDRLHRCCMQCPAMWRRIVVVLLVVVVSKRFHLRIQAQLPRVMFLHKGAHFQG